VSLDIEDAQWRTHGHRLHPGVVGQERVLFRFDSRLEILKPGVRKPRFERNALNPRKIDFAPGESWRSPERPLQVRG
jgi:hypothetical protein